MITGTNLIKVSSFIRAGMAPYFSKWIWPTTALDQYGPGWPKDIPDELPANSMDCVELNIGDDKYPALIMSGRDIQSYSKAFLERRSLLRAQAITKQRVDECTIRIEEAFHKAQDYKRMLVELSGALEEGSPDDASDPEEFLNGIHQRIEAVRAGLDRVERFREDLAEERTMLVFAMLEQHVQTWDTQIEADERLMHRMQQEGLLKETPMNEFHSWKKLPYSYRESCLLHRNIRAIQRESSETMDSEGAANEFARDEASLFSAEANLEILKGHALWARDALKRYDLQAKLRESEYGKARIAGHPILTR